MGWVASVVRPSTLSNDFFSETTGPNVTKFLCIASGALGNEKWPKCLDPKVKMAAMPIYGKTIQTTSIPEPPIRLTFCRKHKGHLLIV